MDFIEGLIQEEKELRTRLEWVQGTLKAYGASNGSNMASSTNKNVFPTKVRTDKQVIWLFENALTKGLKLKDVQVEYNKQIGNDSKKIENVARRLKTEGKLVIVKYNKKHVYSYWGLPTWVNENDFKESHRPNLDLLPEITHSEVVRK